MAKQTFTTGQVLTAAQVNSLQANDFNQTVSVKTASYTLVAADKGTRIEFNTSGSVTCTVNSGLFDAGDTLIIQNRGAGAVTVTAGTATVDTSATLILSQFDSGTLYFVSASASIFFNSDAGGATPLTTKGDLYTFGTSDTRLAVGNNGDTLVADSSTTTGLRWQADWNTGKNKILNGDFAINQRGFTSTTTDAFGLDRWKQVQADGTSTYSVQTFTLGTAPVTGYEAKNFARVAISGQTLTGAATILIQPIESVRTFAGETVTISFWAKANTGTPAIAIEMQQYFGTGGSPSATVNTYAGKATISTSWARYSITATVPSISGKTIGSNNNDCLNLNIWLSSGSNTASRTGSIGIQNNTFDLWGVQVEAGSVATPFTTATGTLAGELAACQRYYFRNNSGNTNYTWFAWGIGQGSSQALFSVPCPVTMRTTPTVIEFANLGLAQTGAINAITTLVHSNSSPDTAFLQSNGTNTADVFYRLIANNSSSAYIGIGAEL